MSGDATREQCIPVNLYWTPGHPPIAQSRLRWCKTVLRSRVHVALIRPQKPAALSEPVRAYPFVRVARREHADILAVNALVPKAMPGREDVRQDILVALLERRVTLGELKANSADLRAFLSFFRRINYEAAGCAISLDAPMRDGRDWHDVLADPASPAHAFDGA